ncbi:proto-oncogene Mas-like [Dermochelys coriacea]|uniref:proto-oncogene Mas-like n=1 Tax=Dermochelys coriacea TaxID=27794 RepID=UPI0018E77E6E|nr:proto-oncogene Mas-like [Dermochelys coriacea]XP_038262430.1 proto-oncogene Mas-like [Dermochelys coriacea]XP_043372820.1 proto-oncogene Mas-like [Dermochelys coriacea]
MMAKLSTVFLPPTLFGLGYEVEYNETGCPLADAPPGTIYGITGLICLFRLVGNGIVLWFLGFHIKRNPFTIYILNLAVGTSNTCFLLCSSTYLITYVVEYPFCVNVVFIFIMLLFSMLALTYSTSLYLLKAISTERCLSVFYPIWHRCHLPKHLSALVSALLWALSMLVSCPVGVFCIVLLDENCQILPPVFVLNVLIFTPVMVLSSLTLFIKVQHSSQQRQPGKLYAVILLTVFFFLLFTVPQSVQIFLSYHNIYNLSEIFHMLASASSSTNPFIYFLVRSYGKWQFYGSIKVSLQRVFEERDSREDGEATSAEPVEMVT